MHALTTLNDPTWVEAARVLAEHSLHHSTLVADQITFAFRKVLGRPPRAKELVTLENAMQKQLAFYAEDPAASKAFVEVGSAVRDPTLEPAKHAAMSAVCLAILNLDEAMTRE